MSFGRLVDCCDEIAGSGVAAFLYGDGQDSQAVPVANVVKRTTRGSLVQKTSRNGVASSSVRIVPDACVRKVAGCPNPRKRIWADIMGNAPDHCKKLKLRQRFCFNH